MVYSDTSSNNGILQMIEQTTGLGLATITGDSDLFQYFNNLINRSYRNIKRRIWKADNDWHFDDSNHTDFPFSTTDLVDSQYDYSIPTGLNQLRQVEVMDSSGNYYTLKKIKSTDPRLKQQKLQETKGQPSHYRLLDRSIILYPKPNSNVVTLTAGLRLTHNRDIDAFTTADTTQEPGFDVDFHDILYYEPSLEWASQKGVKEVVTLCDTMLYDRERGLFKQLDHFYSHRDLQTKTIIKSITQSNNFE